MKLKDKEMASRFTISRYSPMTRVAPVLCFASYLNVLIKIDNGEIMANVMTLFFKKSTSISSVAVFMQQLLGLVPSTAI